MTAAAPAIKSPYPGLRPFEAEESDLFFGREPQVDELLRRLGKSRFVAVIGSSGSGKSSLVRAGLVPALIGGYLTSAGSHWRIAVFRPGGDPIGALRDALHAAFGGGEQDDTSRGLMEITLRRSSLGLVEATRQAQMAEHENLLIIVDQFEELFRFQRARGLNEAIDEAAALVRLLLEAVRQADIPIHVLITMRSDFLGDCSQFRELPETINEGLYLVPRMTRDQFRQAIVGPAAVSGVTVTPRLVQQLLNDIGNDMDQLPILQHALMRAWNRWRNRPGDADLIDIDDYLATGGMAEALSRHADEAFAELTPGDQVLAERLFQCLTEKGPDNREVRRPTRLGDICRILEVELGAIRKIIERFREEDRAFLMPSRLLPPVESRVIDISHESLIRKWDRLRGWVEKEAQSRAIYVRLAQAARLNKRGETGLWRNPELQRALDWKEQARPNEAWAERYEPDFPLAMEFLDRSVADVRNEERREAEMRQAEARAAGMEKARKRVIVLLAAAVTVAALFGWLLFKNSRLLTETVASRLATQAALLQSQKDAALDVSLLLALESMRRVPLALSDEVARNSLALLPQLVMRKQCPAGARAVAFSPNGKYLVAGCDDGSARVIDTASGAEVVLPRHKGRVLAVAFSPDGRMVATGGGDGQVHISEAGTGGEIVSLAHGGEVYAVTFCRNSRYLLTGSYDGTARVMEAVRGGRQIGRIEHGPGAGRASAASASDHRVVTVAFSPDARYVATGSYDGTVRVSTIEGRTMWQANQSGNVYRVAFSPDGRWLATASGDGAARLLDTRQQGHEVARLQHEKPVLDVAFSPDGRYVATASQDHTARLMDVATGKEAGRLTHQEAVNQVVFYPDGQYLATSSDDYTVRVMEVATRREVSRLPLPASVFSIAVSDKGQYVATASADGYVRILAQTTGNEVYRETGLPEIRVAALSPDGKYIALAEKGGKRMLRIVDLSNGSVADLPQQEDIYDVAFDATSRYLAWGGNGKTARVKGIPAGSVVEISQPDAIYGISLSPEGRVLATAGAANTARAFDVAGRREIAHLNLGDSVIAVSLSPDARYLGAGSADKTTAALELTSGKLLPRYTHQDQVNAVAFSPDARFLAAGGADGMLRVIEVATGREISRHPHPNRINAVTFSRDGKHVGTAGEDAVARVMEAATGKEVATIRHPAPVIAVRYLPAETNTLETFAGTALYRHVLGPDALLKQACSQVSRNLTGEEWNQYVRDTPHRKTCENLPLPR